MSTGGPVVSNAGPLLVLAKLNLLHLLERLYTRIHFTPSVYAETVVEGLRQGHDDARTLQVFLDQLQWSPTALSPGEVPDDLRDAHLDTGERETLALALALNAALVLIDETAARQFARARGLPARGTLGVLVEAYHDELISAEQLRLYLTEISRRTDVWISRALIQRVLREVLGDQTA